MEMSYLPIRKDVTNRMTRRASRTTMVSLNRADTVRPRSVVRTLCAPLEAEVSTGDEPSVAASEARDGEPAVVM
jgi:hypothetical protein